MVEEYATRPVNKEEVFVPEISFLFNDSFWFLCPFAKLKL